MIGRIMLALLLLTAAGRAEAPERVEQSTQGSCSPTIDGGNATVFSICNGVDPPPPKMTVAVSEGSDVVQLTDFLRKHDGERIDLRLKCGHAGDVCSIASVDAQPKDAAAPRIQTTGSHSSSPRGRGLARSRGCPGSYGRAGAQRSL